MLMCYFVPGALICIMSVIHVEPGPAPPAPLQLRLCLLVMSDVVLEVGR